jgi:hypothetical protein
MGLDGVQQCASLATELCMSGVSCVAAHQEFVCESQLKMELGCERAAGVNWTACGQVEPISCSALFPDGGLVLPDACLPPIQGIPLSEAQTRCYQLVDQLCAHSLECLGRTATSLDVQSCEDDVTTNLQDGIPCLLAASVGASFAQCAASIPTSPCVGTGAGGAGGSGAPVMQSPACANAITFAP